MVITTRERRFRRRERPPRFVHPGDSPRREELLQQPFEETFEKFAQLLLNQDPLMIKAEFDDIKAKTMVRDYCSGEYSRYGGMIGRIP